MPVRRRALIVSTTKAIVHSRIMEGPQNMRGDNKTNTNTLKHTVTLRHIYSHQGLIPIERTTPVGASLCGQSTLCSVRTECTGHIRKAPKAGVSQTRNYILTIIFLAQIAKRGTTPARKSVLNILASFFTPSKIDEYVTSLSLIRVRLGGPNVCRVSQSVGKQDRKAEGEGKND